MTGSGSKKLTVVALISRFMRRGPSLTVKRSLWTPLDAAAKLGRRRGEVP